MFLVNRRLAIIVPYRNRLTHLQTFIPHITAYFTRDKIDQNIAYQIYVVEQQGDYLFNAGKLRNIGFALFQNQFDYFAFHDVDYLPIWSDYSYPEQPSQLVYYGTVLQESEEFFGAVVLFRKEHFIKANGYSNEYWGWGFQDMDLRLRCIQSGLQPYRRRGTYQALLHPHNGYISPQKLNPIAQRNLLKFRTLKQNFTYQNDGLNNLNFSVLKEVELTNNCQKIMVDIGLPLEQKNPL